jgi:hypothetical protein
MSGKFQKVARHLPDICSISLNFIQFNSIGCKVLKILIIVEFIGVEVRFYSALGGVEKCQIVCLGLQVRTLPWSQSESKIVVVYSFAFFIT